jgi:hypothetical protein
LFLEAKFADSAFSIGFIRNRTPVDYYLGVAILGVSVGVSIFRIRACWWLFAIYGFLGIFLTAKKILSEGIVLRLAWQSWVGIFLFGACVALLVCLPMIRWVAPFGRRQSEP